MKLRNKKTGEIMDKICVHICSFDVNGNECKEIDTETRSLEKVLETWEDYKPQEPLIKDEKIRKAVRAWAEALDLRWFKRCGSTNIYTSRLVAQDAGGVSYTMELAPNDLYGDSITKDRYTLAELCGEKE